MVEVIDLEEVMVVGDFLVSFTVKIFSCKY